MKKLTVPVAKAIAEQAKQKINQKVSDEIEVVKNSYKKSAAWKQYLKDMETAKKLREKASADEAKAFEKVRTALKQKNIYVSGVNRDYHSKELYLIFGHSYPSVDIEDIKNKILIDDFVSGGSQTSDQIVDKIVAEFIK